MVTVPRITTERLLLREARRADFDTFATIVMDPKRRGPAPVDRRTAWRIFNAAFGTWLLDGVGHWMMEERATGAMVGMVGAFVREPPPGPNPGDDLELGWSLVERHRGQGFATEAMRAVVAYVIEMRRPPQVIAHIDFDNPASIRVAEKLGMRHAGDVDFYETRLRRYVLDVAR